VFLGYENEQHEHDKSKDRNSSECKMWKEIKLDSEFYSCGIGNSKEGERQTKLNFLLSLYIAFTWDGIYASLCRSTCRDRRRNARGCWSRRAGGSNKSDSWQGIRWTGDSLRGRGRTVVIGHSDEHRERSGLGLGHSDGELGRTRR
jgi:hypothetical protein